ncbi:hypothetical protein HPP92_011274 [Vanilla planifolia]|uniref:Uncharacterized protein n=1 Tax=Vanilla planifolia TaxID=51239 RepID=A0A835V499_VANPL|nr:hypothetical protein HPP92_011274 [Vanilla planifolia]
MNLSGSILPRWDLLALSLGIQRSPPTILGRGVAGPRRRSAPPAPALSVSAVRSPSSAAACRFRYAPPPSPFAGSERPQPPHRATEATAVSPASHPRPSLTSIWRPIPLQAEEEIGLLRERNGLEFTSLSGVGEAPANRQIPNKFLSGLGFRSGELGLYGVVDFFSGSRRIRYYLFTFLNHLRRMFCLDLLYFY